MPSPFNAPLKSDGLRIIELPIVNVRYIKMYSCQDARLCREKIPETSAVNEALKFCKS